MPASVHQFGQGQVEPAGHTRPGACRNAEAGAGRLAVVDREDEMHPAGSRRSWGPPAPPGETPGPARPSRAGRRHGRRGTPAAESSRQPQTARNRRCQTAVRTMHRHGLATRMVPGHRRGSRTVARVDAYTASRRASESLQPEEGQPGEPGVGGLDYLASLSLLIGKRVLLASFIGHPVGSTLSSALEHDRCGMARGRNQGPSAWVGGAESA